MQDLKDAEDKASSALASFKEQLAEVSAAQSAADNAAAEAGGEVTRLREEGESLRAEASGAQEKRAEEMRDAEEKLTEAQAQVCGEEGVRKTRPSPAWLAVRSCLLSRKTVVLACMFCVSCTKRWVE